MNRAAVYAAIDTERDYQNKMNPNWCHGGKAPVAAELLMMEEYLLKARTAWTGTYGDPQAGMEELRKVLALGVRCCENHGVPSRKA